MPGGYRAHRRPRRAVAQILQGTQLDARHVSGIIIGVDRGRQRGCIEGEKIQVGLDDIGKKKRQPMWFAEARGFKSTKIGLKNTGTKEDSGIIRSKTFPGIAKAMAEQWGSLAP